jgi:hypothetical protein
LEVSLKDQSFINVFLLYESFITFLIFFFSECFTNHSLRNNLFNKIILNKPDFIEEIPLNKINFLLNANSELLAEVGDFIKQSQANTNTNTNKQNI